MIYFYMVLFTAFIVSSFTKKGKKYVKLTGGLLIAFSCILAVHSIFFKDKVKDSTPIGLISADSVGEELGAVYNVEGTVNELYTCTEYTDTKPKEVRILEVDGVICKLCPCEDEYVEEGDEVKLKGRLMYTGDYNILKGCYVLAVK